MATVFTRPLEYLRCAVIEMLAHTEWEYQRAFMRQLLLDWLDINEQSEEAVIIMRALKALENGAES